MISLDEKIISICINFAMFFNNKYVICKLNSTILESQDYFYLLFKTKLQIIYIKRIPKHKINPTMISLDEKIISKRINFAMFLTINNLKLKNLFSIYRALSQNLN